MHDQAWGIAPSQVFEAVLADLPAVDGKVVLDVPCGGGGFTNHLAGKGARCIGMEIAPSGEYRPVVLADMNQRFPFASEAFDVVVSLEGIEHIHDPFHVVDEWFRILRPGGTLILSTPNVHNLRSRVKFLLRGTLYWFDPHEIDRIGHINLVPYFILKHILKTSGFSEATVRGSAAVKPRLPDFACRLMQLSFSKSAEDEKELNSSTLLNAANLIVQAQKPMDA